MRAGKKAFGGDVVPTPCPSECGMRQQSGNGEESGKPPLLAPTQSLACVWPQLCGGVRQVDRAPRVSPSLASTTSLMSPAHPPVGATALVLEKTWQIPQEMLTLGHFGGMPLVDGLPRQEPGVGDQGKAVPPVRVDTLTWKIPRKRGWLSPVMQLGREGYKRGGRRCLGMGCK